MKRKHSKIDALPSDIKEAVEQMILGDYTYRDVCDFVRDTANVTLSEAAVCRYAQGLNASIQDIRLASENMRALTEEMQKFPQLDTTEGIASLKMEYTGVFYDRFILGKWVVAQGAIYKIFSDEPSSYNIVAAELPHLDQINVGLDFGGNESAHALVACGITQDYRRLFALKSEHIPAAGMTPQELYKRVYDFCAGIKQRYGIVPILYGDSAEQTLIAGLRQALKPLGIIVKNALKREINDRIRATTMLMAGGRFKLISEECSSLIDAFQGAVYDDKVIGAEVRLDDGTSDIDTLDAFEYSFERYIPRLIRSEQ